MLFYVPNVGEAMQIQQNTGNVGIGNTNPQHKIHFGEGGGYYTSIGSGNSVPGGATPWLGLFNNTSIASATYGWGVYDSSADGSLQIWNKNSSTTGAVALTIKRGGNVGIGTSNPTTTLSVVNDSTNEGFNVRHSNNTAGIGIGYNTIQATGTNTNQSIYLMSKGAADILFYTNGQQRLHIDSLGTVGIGATSGEANLVVRDRVDGTHKGGRIGFGIHEAGALQIYDAVTMSKTAGSVVTDSTASGGQNLTLSSGQLYGPYHTLPRGQYRLCVKMKTTDASYTGSAARLTLHTSSATVIPESRTVRGVDFGTNNKWQTFSVPFQVVGAATNAVEFYLFALNSQAISVDYFFIMNDTDSYSTKVYGDQIVDGKVGIGTSAPPAPLSIFGTGTNSPTSSNAQQSYDNALFRINNFVNSSTGLSIGSAGGNVTYIQTSYNEGTTAPLTLNPFGGNVGIGTTNPTGKLHIQTTTQGDTTVAQLELATTVNANPSHINQKFSSGAGWIAMIQAEQRAGGQYGALNFWTGNGGNPAQKMTLNFAGDLSVGDSGVQDSPHPLHKKVEVTSAAATATSWSTSSGSNGGYDVSGNDTAIHQNRGSISAAGYYNHHVAHFSLRGNFAANTWYPFTTRTQLQAWIPGAGGSQDTGMPMYFRVYTYDVSGGGGDYLSHRLTDRFWFTSYSSNSTQRHQIPLGPAMGHAPNRGATTDHQDYGNNPIQVSINHTLGTNSYYPASQTFDIWFNQARTGLTGGGAVQVEIYAYIG
jgi:hypothetical protein